MLSIPAGARSAEPIELSAYGPQVNVSIGDHAQVVLYDVLSEASACLDRVIVLGAHSCVRYQLSLVNERARAQARGDGQKISVCVRVVLAGDGARFDGFVRVYCVLGSELTLVLVQEHEAPHANSLFEVKQVLYPGVQSAVHGQIVVGKFAQHARVAQQMRGIVLDPEPGQRGCVRGQHAITGFFLQPELRVENDTAQVTHGAALGNLDPEQLLYVGVRGLSPERAKDLLIAGFLAWP